MTEEQLQAAITETATMAGWLCYHTHDSRGSNPGFPDLVLVHPRYQMIALWELKTGTGRLTDWQKTWGEALAKVDTQPDYRVIRPDDLEEATKWLIRPTRPASENGQPKPASFTRKGH